MKEKTTLLSILFMLVSFLNKAQNSELFLKKEFVGSDNKKLNYRILYPENYDKKIKYPLVLVLHGSGERGIDNEKQLTHGSNLFLKPENRSKFPAFVIFPQCPDNDYWSSVHVNREKLPLGLDFDYERPATDAMNLTMQLLAQLTKQESINTKQIYILGLSMGGMGTFEAVYRNPKKFAAAVPICGAADVAKANEKFSSTPFWIFHGAKDDVVPVEHSRVMAEKLKKYNQVIYIEYPDAKHNSWDNTFAEPNLLAWLFAQKRK